MRTYIQTAGASQAYEYRWFRRTAAALGPETPGTWGLAQGLVETGGHQSSLLLLRHKGRLQLLITQLWSSDRRDFAGRRIYAHLCGEAESPRDDDRLQYQAAKFLSDPDAFAQTIDGLVRPAAAFPGVSVASRLVAWPLCALGEPDRLLERRLIASLDPFRRKELACELLTCRLPPRNGPLILMTPHADLPELEAVPSLTRVLTTAESSNVWRPMPLRAMPMRGPDRPMESRSPVGIAPREPACGIFRYWPFKLLTLIRGGLRLDR